MPKYLGDVRCWVNSGKHLLSLSFSGFDPKLPFLTAPADSRVGWKADIRTVLLRMLTYRIRV
jgi:hypothetical protein